MHTNHDFPPAPTEQRALVLTSHPNPDSFNNALAAAWTRGADAITVESIDVTELDFDPMLRQTDRADQPLEPDLVRVKNAIEQAAHLVIAFPLWWSSTPAVLKGLFDRVLLSGWAFGYHNGRPIGGLTGRSARVIVTMDSPLWYDTLFSGATARRQVSGGTLKFCGLSPVRTTAFGSLRSSTATKRQAMLLKAQHAGAADAKAVLTRTARRLTTSTA